MIAYSTDRTLASGVGGLRNRFRLGCGMKPVTASNRVCEVSAPQVTVRQTEGGYTVEPALDETVHLDEFRTRFLDAFGTTEHSVAEALFQQIGNVLCTHPKSRLDTSMANLVLALLHRIAPKDELEAMLACQMIVAHVAAMDAGRRALHVEQTTGGRQVYSSLARKLMGLFVAQLDALNRTRGKAIVQRVVVERVNVGPGGKAIVGAVTNEPLLP